MSNFQSTILITGGTTGLGYWAAYELAKASPHAKVIIASRSDRDDAVSTLTKLLSAETKTANPASPQIEFLALDLESTSNIRAFVSALRSKNLPPVQKLLLNAGLQYHKGETLRMSPDGVESTFAINHLGHALLFFLLQPLLANDARIVITASGTHDPAQKSGTPDPDTRGAELLAHPDDRQGYEGTKGLQRYTSSKLANVLFGYALERRLKEVRAGSVIAEVIDNINNNSSSSSNVRNRNTSNTTATTSTIRTWTTASFDPGLMPGTSLGREFGPMIMWIAAHVLTRMLWLLKLIIWNKNVHLPRESGRSLARLALMEGVEAEKTSGKYFEGENMIESSKDSYERERQEDLWGWTVAFLATDAVERKSFEVV